MQSLDVENDRFGDDGETTDDRLAQFAAMGEPQQLLNMLLSPFPCEGVDDRGNGTSYETSGALDERLNAIAGRMADGLEHHTNSLLEVDGFGPCSASVSPVALVEPLASAAPTRSPTTPASH